MEKNNSLNKATKKVEKRKIEKPEHIYIYIYIWTGKTGKKQRNQRTEIK
jgi:hypothetical protein